MILCILQHEDSILMASVSTIRTFQAPRPSPFFRGRITSLSSSGIRKLWIRLGSGTTYYAQRFVWVTSLKETWLMDSWFTWNKWGKLNWVRRNGMTSKRRKRRRSIVARWQRKGEVGPHTDHLFLSDLDPSESSCTGGPRPKQARSRLSLSLSCGLPMPETWTTTNGGNSELQDGTEKIG